MLKQTVLARSVVPLAAASFALLLAGCPADETTTESDEIEDIPADVTAVEPSQVERDANELRPAPTAEGATQDLAIDADEAADTDEAAEPADR